MGALKRYYSVDEVSDRLVREDVLRGAGSQEKEEGDHGNNRLKTIDANKLKGEHKAYLQFLQDLAADVTGLGDGQGGGGDGEDDSPPWLNRDAKWSMADYEVLGDSPRARSMVGFGEDEYEFLEHSSLGGKEEEEDDSAGRHTQHLLSPATVQRIGGHKDAAGKASVKRSVHNVLAWKDGHAWLDDPEWHGSSTTASSLPDTPPIERSFSSSVGWQEDDGSGGGGGGDDYSSNRSGSVLSEGRSYEGKHDGDFTGAAAEKKEHLRDDDEIGASYDSNNDNFTRSEKRNAWVEDFGEPHTWALKASERDYSSTDVGKTKKQTSHHQTNKIFIQRSHDTPQHILRTP